jgi:hypothetical protein
MKYRIWWIRLNQWETEGGNLQHGEGCVEAEKIVLAELGCPRVDEFERMYNDANEKYDERTMPISYYSILFAIVPAEAAEWLKAHTDVLGVEETA